MTFEQLGYGDVVSMLASGLFERSPSELSSEEVGEMRSLISQLEAVVREERAAEGAISAEHGGGVAGDATSAGGATAVVTTADVPERPSAEGGRLRRTISELSEISGGLCGEFDKITPGIRAKAIATDPIQWLHRPLGECASPIATHDRRP